MSRKEWHLTDTIQVCYLQSLWTSVHGEIQENAKTSSGWQRKILNKFNWSFVMYVTLSQNKA